jgi:hypothetical protein
MIDRQGNRIVLECDSCEETFEGDEDAEWADVWAVAKREGWRSKKIGDEWIHGCGKCRV